MQPQRLAHQHGLPVVGLPSVGPGAVEVTQVVEPLVGAPAGGATGVVEHRIPVHVAVRSEVTGRPVLESRVLPLRHRTIMPAVWRGCTCRRWGSRAATGPAAPPAAAAYRPPRS